MGGEELFGVFMRSLTNPQQMGWQGAGPLKYSGSDQLGQCGVWVEDGEEMLGCRWPRSGAPQSGG